MDLSTDLHPHAHTKYRRAFRQTGTVNSITFIVYNNFNLHDVMLKCSLYLQLCKDGDRIQTHANSSGWQQNWILLCFLFCFFFVFFLVCMRLIWKWKYWKLLLVCFQNADLLLLYFTLLLFSLENVCYCCSDKCLIAGSFDLRLRCISPCVDTKRSITHSIWT